MASCWLATHYVRLGTPTDEAWIESLFGDLKTEQPHLELIEDIDVPAPNSDSNESITTRSDYTPGSATSRRTRSTEAKGEAIRAARRTGLEQARDRRIAYHRNNQTRPKAVLPSGADVGRKVLASEGRAGGDEVGGRAHEDELAAVVAGAGAEVDDPVGVRHDRLVVLDHDDRFPGID